MVTLDEAKHIYTAVDVFFNIVSAIFFNSPGKRWKMDHELQRLDIDIAFLQETHLVHEEGIKLSSKGLPVWIYGDSPSKRAKGVAIGFSRRIKLNLIDKRVDPEGRFLFVKIKMNEKMYTLVNIYCPNRDPMGYLARTLIGLEEFKEGEVILAGDLNFCLDPALDRSADSQWEDKRACARIGKKLQVQQLIDVWRVLHPKESDYTFYSQVHATYSRLDYFLVDHSLLDSVTGTKIEIQTLSDHAPVVMTLLLKGPQRIPYTWRLNEFLLNKKQVVERVQREIEGFFHTNESEEVPATIVWETFKAYIRGVLISIGTGEKRERVRKQEGLIEQIYKLERTHKTSKEASKEVLRELTIKRDELRDLLETEALKRKYKNSRDFHIRGNKIGKHLPASIRKKRMENYIERVKSKKGEMRYSTREIAEEFRSYFSSLYAVEQKEKQEGKKEQMVSEFLKEAALPTLSQIDSLELERPISEEEVFRALKQSPGGKSPGPDGFTTNFYKKFKVLLVPRLCQMWNGLGDQEMCGDALLAAVTLIPKEGRDRTLCSSYRPIALLNEDTKLYAKVSD